MKYSFLLIFVLLLYCRIAFAQKPELINSGEIIKNGTMLYDSGQYKKALKIYSKISRSDTNYVWSLYKKALACEADSQYNQAVIYCKEALSLKEQRDYEPDVYNTYGNCLADMGKNDEAVKVFDSALKKYPSYSLFYFNKGVAFLNQKRFPEAETQFQQTLLINPYMYSAHYQLGLAALNQGKVVPAFLCFMGYLLVNPEGKYWSKSINGLDQISRGTDAIMEFINKRTQPDQRYQETEDILLAKIALDKQYKLGTSLDDAITRQVQAIIEKLEYQPSDKDFYIQYYLPYYKQAYNNHQFDPFIYHLFANAKIDAIQNYRKKNKKDIDALITNAGDYFDNLRATRELNWKKRDSINERYYYENGQLVGKGVLINKGKTLNGHWEFYYPAGNMKSIGLYNSSGGREGNWPFYFVSGKLKSMQRYANAKQEGEQLYYYENGNLSSRENCSAGNLNGPYTTYYYAGSIKSTGNYLAGKKQGEQKDFYSNGNPESINNYANGVLNGLSQTYYKSGSKKEIQHYVNGKSDGEYKSFYESGGVDIEGMNVKDNADGEWKYYYQDGKLKEKRTYVANNETGLHQEYFENSQLSGTYNVKKDKINGEATYYYEDGKLLSQFVYENGVVKSLKYLNKQGQVLSNATLKNELIDVVSYDSHGNKSAHFSFNKKGELEGSDSVFFPSGRVSQVNGYKTGALNGNSVTYYLNGNKKTEVNMSDGKENGLQTNYYIGGKIETEGWVTNGQYQGEWHNYDESGKLSSIYYYLDGELNGYKEDYLPDGRKTLEQKYHLGWLEEMTQFDVSGKIMKQDSFPKGSGKYALIYPGGKVMQDGNYVNGDFDGPFKSYYFDGSLQSLLYYSKGLKDSTYTDYYFGGQKNTEGQYHSGNKTGLWKSWNEDGKLLWSINYADDRMNGPQTYFLPTGEKDFVAPYKDDQMSGTASKYDPDGTLAYQTIFEAGDIKEYTYLGKDGKLLPAVPIAIINGTLKSYFPNGQLSRTCSYFDGIKNGLDMVYYTNGQLRVVDTFAYGVQTGTSKQYYPSGKVKSEYHYANDNYNGICREYNEKGMLEKEIIYENGVYHGPVKYFNANGKLTKTWFYDYGVLISAKNEE